MIYIVAAGNIIMGAVFAFFYKTLPPQVPMFYSRQTGEDQLGEWWMLFFIPLFMNLLIALNSFLVRRYFPDNDFVRKVRDYINIGLVVSLTAIFLKIIILVA